MIRTWGEILEEPSPKRKLLEELRQHQTEQIESIYPTYRRREYSEVRSLYDEQPRVRSANNNVNVDVDAQEIVDELEQSGSEDDDDSTEPQSILSRMVEAFQI